MQSLKLKFKAIEGCAMLMHSDRFANPLDPATKLHKEMTSKRKKTDEDYEAIARSEFLGSLYIDQDGPYIPGINMESCFVEAAKMQKLGKHAKRAMMILEDKLHLKYEGPKQAEKLWNDLRFRDSRSVRVSMAKLIRYRPKFTGWEAECTLVFNAEQINENELRQIIKNAGALVGVGDFRPRHGRFTVEFEGV